SLRARFAQRDGKKRGRKTVEFLQMILDEFHHLLFVVAGMDGRRQDHSCVTIQSEVFRLVANVCDFSIDAAPPQIRCNPLGDPFSMSLAGGIETPDGFHMASFQALWGRLEMRPPINMPVTKAAIRRCGETKEMKRVRSLVISSTPAGAARMPPPPPP